MRRTLRTTVLALVPEHWRRRTARPWAKIVAGSVAVLVVAYLGLIVWWASGLGPGALAGCAENDRPLNRLACRSLLLSPLRPTRDEVMEMNNSAGAARPALTLQDRAFAESVLTHYIDAGVDINAFDLTAPARYTALHYAAMGTDPAPVRLLLAHGADPATRDANGQTPLDLANMLQHRNTTLDHSGVIAVLEAVSQER